MAGAGIYSLLSPDVRLNPSRRHKTIRSSEEKRGPSIVSRLSNPVNPEGVGIDHEKWKKSKGA